MATLHGPLMKLAAVALAVDRPPRAPIGTHPRWEQPKKPMIEAFADSGVAAAGVDFGHDCPSQRIADGISQCYTQFVRQLTRGSGEKSLYSRKMIESTYFSTR